MYQKYGRIRKITLSGKDGFTRRRGIEKVEILKDELDKNKSIVNIKKLNKKDEQVIDRLKEVLDRMKCINENITN